MTKIIWITTQFPSSPKDTKGSFIYRTVAELSKEYNLTVICLHSVVPPIIPMLKDFKNSVNIYKVWRNKYPKTPIVTAGLKSKVIYAKYIRLPRGKFHYLEGWFGYFGVRKYLKDLIKKDTFIHATWLFPEGDLANIIHKKYNIPFLVTLMGRDVHFLKEGTIKWNKTKEIIENSKYITSVSQALYEALESKSIHVPKEMQSLTHTIYEFDNFLIKDKEEVRAQFDINNSKRIIFYAGTLRKIKNVNVLIEAFELLQNKTNEGTNNKNLILIIAGTGEEEGKLKQLSISKGLFSSVEFVGGLSGAEIIEYYNLADVFCLPSKNEGLPNVIIESLLCGTPVVASAVGEIPYIIKDGINGFLAEPNMAKDLSEKIGKALNSSWNKKELRKSVEWLSPENVMQEYENVYKKMLDK